MKHNKAILAALTLAASLVLSPINMASAATLLYDQTHDYGIGQYDPSGTANLGADIVTLDDSLPGGNRFSDIFNFSGVTGTIESIVLTLKFAGAGPVCPGGFCFLGEDWDVRAQGSNSGAQNDDLFTQLVDGPMVQSMIYDVSTDNTNVNVFLHSTSIKKFAFWFSENSLGDDTLDLDYANLKVYGVSAVPVPPALVLFLTGLGGMAMMGRRRRKAKVAA